MNVADFDPLPLVKAGFFFGIFLLIVYGYAWIDALIARYVARRPSEPVYDYLPPVGKLPTPREQCIASRKHAPFWYKGGGRCWRCGEY
jgi:hypothetical protein